MKYATTRTFDGQRARVGMVVVVRDRQLDIVAGIIARVDVEYGEDRVVIAELDAPMAEARDSMRFVPTKTESDINALPENAWTWPVAV